MESKNIRIKRALLSVSDKTGLIELAKGLIRWNVELISTGGTEQHLVQAGIKPRNISEVTDFPEILDGRVKTLHPMIHGGILAIRDSNKHMETIQKEGIPLIDLVCINLYPFGDIIQNPQCSLNEAIENIDIGGPSLLRSASKNFRDVVVLSSPQDYAALLKEMDENQGAVSLSLREKFAVKSFSYTAQYDSTIFNFFNQKFQNEITPTYFVFSGKKIQEMRYGENPHQKAAFYAEPASQEPSLTHMIQHQGKELSYNNIVDSDSALNLISEFTSPALCIVKHTNPCGVAIDANIHDAFLKAWSTDPISAFGGIIAVNQLVSANLAELILEKLKFFEIILAPAYEKEALIFFSKRPQLRVLEIPSSKQSINGFMYDFKKVNGGFLVQTKDSLNESIESYQVVTKTVPTKIIFEQMIFGWKVVKHIKSNGIILVKDGKSVGIGVGQTSRVGSLEIAIRQAEMQANESVMASDALLPFSDSVELCKKHGICGIIQTGGSVRDKEVIESADEAGIPMVFTGIRHFKH